MSGDDSSLGSTRPQVEVIKKESPYGRIDPWISSHPGRYFPYLGCWPRRGTGAKG